MLSISPINQNQITFKSIKPSIKIGEKIIQEIKTEYPRIFSPAMLSIKMGNTYPVNLSNKCTPCLADIYNRNMQSIDIMRDKMLNLSFDNYIKKLLDFLKTKNIANCSEMNRLAQYKLREKGIKSTLVMCVVDNDEVSRNVNDHTFVVINLAKDALIKNPKTWGNNAVIVDAWLKESGSANDIILKYETLFNLRGKEFLKFCEEKYMSAN